MPRIRGVKEAGAALFEALTGRSAKNAEKADIAAKTKDMIKRFGSVKAVADRIGKSVRTVQRYKNGEQDPAKNKKDPTAKDKVDAAHRAAVISAGKADKFRGAATAPAPGVSGVAGTGLSIYGRIRVSEDVRDRWINPGYKMPQSALDAVIDAMIQQGPEAAVIVLNRALQNYYAVGTDMTVEEIYEIEYE